MSIDRSDKNAKRAKNAGSVPDQFDLPDNPEQAQEIPAGDNPEPQLDPGAFPGPAPGFFPYAQYPNLTWQPRVDIFEDHDNILVVVEVPGVKPEQLNVENSANLLLISGQTLPVAGSGGSMIPRHRERICGNFARELSLPPQAATGQAQAKCSNGLLEIVIPKQKPAASQPGRRSAAPRAKQQ